MKDLLTLMTLLLGLARLVSTTDDYWAEDFDKNKNCVREEEMPGLKMSGRCSVAGIGGRSLLSLLSRVGALIQAPPSFSGRSARNTWPRLSGRSAVPGTLRRD